MQDKSGQLIVVTGATGLIGRAIVRNFVQQGHHVKALIRSKENMYTVENSESGKLSFWEADLMNLTEPAARQACEGASALIHCAGLVHQPNASVDLYPLLNEKPTELLARAAQAENVSQFVFLSSSSVYGNKETNMIHEDAPCIPDTPYASSKINCEQILRENPPSKSTVIVRPSMVFGEGDRGNMLSLIRQILSGRYFLISQGTAQKNLIFADDFAHAMHLLLEQKAVGMHTYNVANPEPVSMHDLSMAISGAAGKTGSIPSLPGALLRPVGALANAILGSKSPLTADRLDKLTRTNSISIERFCRDYAFTPQWSLKDALAKEIAWAKSANLL